MRELNRGSMAHNTAAANFALSEVIVRFEVSSTTMAANMRTPSASIACARTSSLASATSLSNFAECVFVVALLMSFCVPSFFSDSVAAT